LADKRYGELAEFEDGGSKDYAVLQSAYQILGNVAKTTCLEIDGRKGRTKEVNDDAIKVGRFISCAIPKMNPARFSLDVYPYVFHCVSHEKCDHKSIVEFIHLDCPDAMDLRQRQPHKIDQYLLYEEDRKRLYQLKNVGKSVQDRIERALVSHIKQFGIPSMRS
jgi:hypothetical protein